MGLGSEVHHLVWHELPECLAYCGGIADIELGKTVTGAVRDLIEGSEMARIGQLIDVEDLVVCLIDKVAYQRRTDESGTACDKNLYGGPPGSVASLKNGSWLSRSERTGSAVMGHSMASVGSFQRMPYSSPGA